MNLSRLERYILACLVSSSAVLVWYFVRFNQLTQPESGPGAGLLSLYIITVALFTVVHIALVIIFPKKTKDGDIQMDERDLMIELKSFKFSYYFIFSAIILMTFYYLTLGVINDTGNITISMQPYHTFHILFTLTFLSYILQLAIQLFYYRRGI